MFEAIVERYTLVQSSTLQFNPRTVQCGLFSYSTRVQYDLARLNIVHSLTAQHSAALVQHAENSAV